MPQPRLPHPRVDPLRLVGLVDADAEALVAHDGIEGLRIADADVAGRDLTGTSLTECVLADCSAHETAFRGARFLQSRIERMDAPILAAPRSTFRDVEIVGSRFGSAELYEAEFSGVLVAESKLGWVNLRSATLRDVIFRDCVFDEVDLSGASLTRVAFEGCRAGKLVLTGATAQHLDLRGLDLEALDGISGLRGATIGADQAVRMLGLFAEHLGVTID